VTRQEGEFLLTEHGVEGNLIYALSAPLRDGIETAGSATLHVDLVPGREQRRLAEDLAHPRGRDSLANHLRRRTGIRVSRRPCCTNMRRRPISPRPNGSPP
jgi:predicted flavoprotein YhiN